MAIKIPCGNIYGTPQHKLPKTFIDNVEYKNNDLQYSIDYLTLVETIHHTFENDNSWENNSSNNEQESQIVTAGGVGIGTMYSTAQSYIKAFYSSPIVFYINKYSNKQLNVVSRLYEKTNSIGEPYVKYEVKVSHNKKKIRIDYVNGKPNEILEENTTTVEQLDKSLSHKTISTPDITGVNGTATSETSITDKSTVKDATLYYNPYLKQFYTRLVFLVGKKTISYYGTEETNLDVYIDKYRIEDTYTPLSLEVSFYGDIEKYEKVEIPLTFEEGKNVFATESNELLQSETKIGDKTANEIKSQSIIDAYKDGKETLEIKCSIGEYYDESNNLMISTKDSSKPMTFKIGDITIPYKYTVQGEQPLSLNQDRTPKKFVVTGITPFFDGATWQKLILQEI